MNIKYLILLLLILGCSTTPRKKNNLEIELDKILENQTKEELEKIDFFNFNIDWENPNKWESSCAYYQVIPKVDTFKNKYWVDFCYDKYRWWEKD